MSEASNVFMNSYLKKLRRPEFGTGYNPDQAYGANLLKGSESLNPNAIRDKTNAMFGGMKSPVTQGPSANIPGMGGAQNMPIMGGNQNTPFSQLMTAAVAPAGKYGADWMGKSIYDTLKSLTSKPTETLASNMGLAAESPTETMMSALREPRFGVESGLGGYEGVAEEFTKDIPMPSKALESGSMLEGFDPSSLATTGVATVAPKLMELLSGSKTAGNATSAVATTGLAAAQGGLNPISDLAAVYSLYKLIRGLF